MIERGKVGWILGMWLLIFSTLPSYADNVLKNVSPQESATLIAANAENPYFKILDVRTPAEFVTGHLKAAKMLDFYSDSFLQALNKLDQNQTYLIYCRSGRRSGQTLNLMKALGFKKVYNMSGGFLRWQAENRPFTQQF